MKFSLKKALRSVTASPRKNLARGLHSLLNHGLEPPLPSKWRKPTEALFQKYWDGAIDIEELFRSFYSLTDPSFELDVDYYYLWFLDRFRDFLENIDERGRAQLREIAWRVLDSKEDL